MVSNQALTRSTSTGFRLLSGLVVLTFAAGCQTTSQAPVANEPAPRSSPAPMASAPAVQQTAIEAALAREASQGATPAPVTTVQRPELLPNAPMSYTVQRGDTLWDIASLYLRDPWLWPEIWHVNPAVQNPHLIYPGDVLTLAQGADGSPQVTVSTGSALRVQPVVRTSDLDGGAIPTIPYQTIAAFLGKPGIISNDELRDAPRVAALRDRHIIAGSGSDVYVKGLRNHGPGRYNIMRIGDALKDPESGKVLGYLGVYAGVAQVDEASDLSKARVLASARETAAGDVLLAEDTTFVASDIVPHVPSSQIDGQIMAVVDGVSLIGQYRVVAVNRGTEHGVGVGNVLAIEREGAVVRDGSCRRSGLSLCKGTVKLPNERAGSLLIFKTYDRMSYALVLSTTEPVAVADRVHSPR